EAIVDLDDGAMRELTSGELSPRSGPIGLAKGDDIIEVERAPSPRRPPDLGLGAGLGVRHGVAQSTPWLPDLRLQASFGRTSGLLLGLDLASGSAPGFRERAAYLQLGYYFRAVFRGRWSARAGWEICGGSIVQTVDIWGDRWSLAGGTGPRLAGSLAI